MFKKIHYLPPYIYPKGNHPLEKAKPSQVLYNCFREFGFFCRYTGILPIYLDCNTGYAKFRWTSWSMIPYLIYVIALGITSALYLPLYVAETNSHVQGSNNNVAQYILQNLFIGSQMTGAVFTIILIPFISRDISKVWNRMVNVVIYVVSNGQGHVYKRTFIKSRIFLPFYMVMMGVYVTIFWREFSQKGSLDKTYLPKSISWLHAIGLVLFFGMLFFHICHIVVLQFFVFTLGTTLRGMRKCIQRQEKKDIKGLVEKYQEVYEISKDLGSAFGFYLMIELAVMMTCLLMNSFEVLDHFQQRDPYSTLINFFAFVWLITIISEGGEFLKLHGLQCLEKIHDAADDNPPEVNVRNKLRRLQTPKFSAGGYFNVNRKLFTAMGSTFATFFVVIIQFKLNSINENQPCNKSTVVS